MTDFTTKLTSTIELTDEWEVGLAEIMFPRSWCTIPQRGVFIEVDCPDFSSESSSFPNGDSPKFHNDDRHSAEIYLRGGYYNSMEELTEELNRASIRAFDYTKKYRNGLVYPKFEYTATAKRMIIWLPATMSIQFPPVLETILGLSPSQNPLTNNSYFATIKRGDRSCDLQAGLHALYVYCDLLQFTHVGNIKAPLLRVVDSGGEAGDVITRYYERPRYIPLQKKNFDSIQIIIRDDLGEKIQFENGKVLLTLHFRRARNKYLI